MGWNSARHGGGSTALGYVAQIADLTRLRAEFDWIRAVYVSCQQQALRELDRAFGNFFAGRAAPRSCKRGVDDSFRFPGREVAVKRLNADWSAVRLPKIGWVKYCDSRPIRGVEKNVTVSLDPLGWNVAFTCEIAHAAPAAAPDVVGIDRGVATTLAQSTGERLTLPARLERIEVQKRKAQRILARRKRGSNRRRRAQARLARLQARQARIRREFHHRAAFDIAKRFGVAVLEDLNTRGMTASARDTVVEPRRNIRQEGRAEQGYPQRGLAPLRDDPDRQDGEARRAGGHHARAVHVADLRGLRCWRCEEPREPSALRLNRLRPRGSRRLQCGCQHRTAVEHIVAGREGFASAARRSVNWTRLHGLRKAPHFRPMRIGSNPRARAL
ncbi:RNA-guided endonuclease InsQ/TnpB family protein [Methylobacterium fujisawaense]|uniref:RNA-guided endonuclease InsQ/TnpB family protein n=1 Tax=Methylobacterium fujisawaense TaxID=107400 RepID=UPI00313AD1F8